MRRNTSWIRSAAAPLALALLSGCGREVNDGAGDAEAIHADVFWALDPDGTDVVTTIRTDTPRAYCIAKLAAAVESALTFTFESPELKTPSSKTLHSTLALADVEAPHVDPLTRNPVSEVCNGYCALNGAGCPSGYTDEQDNSCGAGATCCYSPFVRTTYPYPVGTLSCTVDIGGAPAGTANLVVTYPPDVGGQTCPMPPPEGGSSTSSELCAGWVPVGAVCNGCTCKDDFWDCAP
jgi:hypothetical protein